MFRLPKQLVAGDDIDWTASTATRQALGTDKLAAVQALPHKFLLEFTLAAHKAHFDHKGLDFRGVNIRPFPAYERIVRVLVDRAPLPLSDEHCLLHFRRMADLFPGSA